jgi:hypothetical protein
MEPSTLPSGVFTSIFRIVGSVFAAITSHLV